MTYRPSIISSALWGAGGLLLIALAFAVAVTEESGSGPYLASVLGAFALAVLWQSGKAFETLIVDERALVYQRFGSEKRLEWDAVSGVQLQDGQTVLTGADGTSISVGRYHPAYNVVTQSVLDRYRRHVIADAGTSFRLSPLWLSAFAVMGLLSLAVGVVLAGNGGAGFWFGLASVGVGGGVILMATALPRSIEIKDDEVVIGRLTGKRVFKRSDVAEIRTIGLAGSGYPSVEIVRTVGGRILVQFMREGQLRLWLALVAWKRG